MWCFVTEPNGTIHELILPKESYGIDCLEMIAFRINLVETDYFGLQYTNPSGVTTWLNLRNKLTKQLTGKSPHRIQLMVKFFVNIQELQQQITRDLFYSSIINQIEHNKLIKGLDKLAICKVIALIAQIQFGDFNAEALPEYSSLLPSSSVKWTRDFQKCVETEHLKLDMKSPTEAKIEFIKTLSSFPDYGMEVFYVTSAEEQQKNLMLGVRHDGLRIFQIDPDTQDKKLVQLIQYDEISTVCYKGKKFTIVHGDSRNEHTHSTFMVQKNQFAINLFRTFTEFHSFYQCNVVKKSVIEKCSRTSVGKFLSVFTSGEKGKMFLFDVTRTRRQAYDNAWSILNAPNKKRQSAFYHSDRHLNRKSVYALNRVDDGGDEKESTVLGDFDSLNLMESEHSKIQQHSSDDSEVKALSVAQLREKVENLLEDKVCQVCMDAEVSTAFCPCGHVICCVHCAGMCRECPLCRTQITYAQRVFFTCQ